MEQLQSHIWLMASLYMVKYLRIFSYIRKPFLVTLQLLHSEFPYQWGKFDILFYLCKVSLNIMGFFSQIRLWFLCNLLQCTLMLSRNASYFDAAPPPPPRPPIKRVGELRRTGGSPRGGGGDIKQILYTVKRNRLDNSWPLFTSRRHICLSLFTFFVFKILYSSINRWYSWLPFPLS